MCARVCACRASELTRARGEASVGVVHVSPNYVSRSILVDLYLYIYIYTSICIHLYLDPYYLVQCDHLGVAARGEASVGVVHGNPIYISISISVDLYLYLYIYICISRSILPCPMRPSRCCSAKGSFRRGRTW